MSCGYLGHQAGLSSLLTSASLALLIFLLLKKIVMVFLQIIMI